VAARRDGLGSRNHYLEVQEIADIYDPEVAAGFELRQGEVVVTIHCGTRGLGHQIGTESLRAMVLSGRVARALAARRIASRR
jgi:tRNA-splicing ligase RtcB (3'-phosphate/5'-hydroxy nucleic acid ligase)